MAQTGKADIVNMIPKVWSSKFYEELRAKSILQQLFAREYEGEIKSRGDQVNVSQITVPTAETLANDKTQFTPAALGNNTFALVANKQTVASFEFTDLAQLQSISFMEEAKKALTDSLRLKIEAELLAQYVAAVTGYVIATPGDLAVADLVKARTLLSKAKVPTADRFMLLDPEYYGHLLSKGQIVSNDYRSTDATNSGELGARLMGFNVMEHDGLSALSGLAFHKSAVQMVTQREVQIKISDLHSNNKLGFLMSADIVWGSAIFDANRCTRLKNA
jgi:hypothetical protein